MLEPSSHPMRHFTLDKSVEAGRFPASDFWIRYQGAAFKTKRHLKHALPQLSQQVAPQMASAITAFSILKSMGHSTGLSWVKGVSLTFIQLYPS
jgi:hypothetical protein